MLMSSVAAWKLHYSGTGKGAYKAAEQTGKRLNLTQIEMLVGSKIEPEKHQVI